MQVVAIAFCSQNGLVGAGLAPDDETVAKVLGFIRNEMQQGRGGSLGFCLAEGKMDSGGEGKMDSGGEGKMDSGGEGKIDSGGEGKMDSGGEAQTDSGKEANRAGVAEARKDLGASVRQTEAEEVIRVAYVLTVPVAAAAAARRRDHQCQHHRRP